MSPLRNSNKDCIVLREDWRWELTQIFVATQYSWISCKLNGASGELTSSLSIAVPFAESSDERWKEIVSSGYRLRKFFFALAILLANSKWPTVHHGGTTANNDGQINISWPVDNLQAGKKNTWLTHWGARKNLSRPSTPSNTGFPHVRRFGVFTLAWHARLSRPRWPRGRCWPWLLAGAECRTLTLTSRDSWPIDAQMVEKKGMVVGEGVRVFESLFSRTDIG